MNSEMALERTETRLERFSMGLDDFSRMARENSTGSVETRAKGNETLIGAFERIKTDLERNALAITRNVEDAQDAVQQAYMACMVQRGIRNPAGLLVEATTCKALDIVRSRKRRRGEEVTEDIADKPTVSEDVKIRIGDVRRLVAGNDRLRRLINAVLVGDDLGEAGKSVGLSSVQVTRALKGLTRFFGAPQVLKVPKINRHNGLARSERVRMGVRYRRVETWCFAAPRDPANQAMYEMAYGVDRCDDETILDAVRVALGEWGKCPSEATSEATSVAGLTPSGIRRLLDAEDVRFAWASLTHDLSTKARRLTAWLWIRLLTDYCAADRRRTNQYTWSDGLGDKPLRPPS